MPSKYYNENWKKTNEWLNKNAPEYVIKCVEELAVLATNMSKDLLDINKSFMQINAGLSRQSIKIQEIKQDLNSLDARLQYRQGGLDNE